MPPFFPLTWSKNGGLNYFRQLARKTEFTELFRRALEQRHADRVRELTEQVKAEQEQLTQQNAHLERRVAALEAEEVHMRAELQRLQGENQQLQEEHQALIGQLTTLRTERDGLRRNVQELSLIQQKVRSSSSFFFSFLRSGFNK